MDARWISVVGVVASIALAGCGDSGERERSTVASQVAPQLRYLDPESAAVFVFDLRVDGPNWEDLRPLLSRVLRSYRESVDGAERLQVPANVDGALAMLASFGGLDFEQDIKPALDGHLVLGFTQPRPSKADSRPAPKLVLVYRTDGGDLRHIAEAVADGAVLKPIEGHDDAMLFEEGIAVVGDDTLVVVDGPGGQRRLLDEALDRGERDAGVPADRLAAAERDTGIDDPLILGAGDLRIVDGLFEPEQLARLRAEVPYFVALRRGALAVEASGDDGLSAIATLITDPTRLDEDDLPVGSSGELELPVADDAVVGGSRNQSRTTTLLSQAARSVYRDSRFARAVARAEADLGIEFDAEVLRQFDCPSISILEPPGNAPARFAARSCLRDPDRMRELLPRLRPHLPAIVKGLQGLGDEGLAGLLLIAPDAPLTPSALVNLAQIVVSPVSGDDEAKDEQLYEIGGLHDDPVNDAALAGPAQVVFGLIGDDFVVASDLQMARDVADARTRPIDEDAGAAATVPLTVLGPWFGGLEEIAAVFPRIELTVTATLDRTTVRGWLRLEG